MNNNFKILIFDFRLFGCSIKNQKSKIKNLYAGQKKETRGKNGLVGADLRVLRADFCA
jgi:hypothetical protein